MESDGIRLPDLPEQKAVHWLSDSRHLMHLGCLAIWPRRSQTIPDAIRHLVTLLMLGTAGFVGTRI